MEGISHQPHGRAEDRHSKSITNLVQMGGDTRMQLAPSLLQYSAQVFAGALCAYTASFSSLTAS
jgi:hypothetical protein